MKTGLVLEGGGMRGLYTVGVLDWFMEQHFMADYVIGVSAGAGNGSSYVSGQRGRAYRVDVDYLGDKLFCVLPANSSPGLPTYPPASRSISASSLPLRRNAGSCAPPPPSPCSPL